ncbi:MAG: hypothetical protein LBU18_07555 [Treponema sp.]|jgi:DNA modification methylase|nr:hypothetical protein [Treponema sp.]
MVNKLILGDNLEILKGMEAETVDLIYLDPPFFSNRNYEVIWGDAGEVRSFQDRWSGGMDHYTDWLYERVEQMHRVLKQSGSVYLHCDWHADAYIRVNILDKIFGMNNFIADIIWYYSWGGRSFKRWNRKHDVIYHYSKSGSFTFNVNEVLDERMLTEASKKRLEYSGAMIMKNADTKEDPNFIPPSDVWYIATINAMSKERIGYPTQKPEALLERIIKASSNEGGLVLDPFMGGGTTIAVADRLGRQWIGIDQSVQAVKVTEFRLEKQYGAMDGQAALFSAPYIVHLHKYDRDVLFNEDPFKFETWIIQQFGGAPQNKKGGDKGVDGKTKDGTPIQVKQSNNIGVNVVKNFSVSAKQFDKILFDKNVMEKKPAGYIIAFSFGRGAVEEAARLKNSENIIIELVKVEKIVPLSEKPNAAVHINELKKYEDGGRKIELLAAAENQCGEFFEPSGSKNSK